MSEQNHTPTPWYINDRAKMAIEAKRDDLERVVIATTGGYSNNMVDSYKLSNESHANAEFIVRACNAHNDLVAGCRRAVQLLQNRGFTKEATELLDIIAKAEGDQS